LAESDQSIDLELKHQPSLVRQRSSIGALSDLVPVIIDSLLKQTKSKNMKVRVSGMHTISSLAHVLHSKLEPCFDKLLPEFEKNMKETSSYELILDTLTVLRRLFRSTGSYNSNSSFHVNYQKVMNIVMEALNHEYSKVVSEGLRVAGSFVYILRGADKASIDDKYTSVVAPLHQAIMDKLQKTDIDQEVKQCSIIAMSSFITVCHKKLTASNIQAVIAIYQDRLQNELTRDATLKAITKIALNQEAPTSASIIQITNFSSLLPKMFDLLHKT
jgi:hypothetical protein